MKFNIWNDFPQKPLPELLDFIVDNRGKTVPTVSQEEACEIVLIATNCIRNENLYPVYEKVRCISKETYEKWFRAHPISGDIIFVNKGTPGRICFCPENIDFCIAQDMMAFRVNSSVLYNKYLLAVLRSREMQEQIRITSVGDTIPHFKKEFLKELTIPLPPMDVQQIIGDYYFKLSEKIELNKKINENLEQQAQAIFKSWFGADIENLNPSNCKSLGELVTSVDNRGKTPPLSNEKTEYPIIDVRALSGSGRIINFSNCTKYVEEETYNNWFRNGHPKDYDILISTVGSLAEMKIYLGNIGCIAQNVVGFRSKGLSPIYLYQYLNYIRKELVSYNIGSVQPSIKVTHIIKHPIFIPENDKIEKFDMLIKDYTLKIYNNCCENKRLVELRDTLLPKLMNGEIDISKVKT